MSMGKTIGFMRAFLRWWMGELVACVPPRIKQRLAHKPQTVVLPYGADLSDLDPAVRRKVARGKVGVTVRLPVNAALTTQISLPTAAAANLAEVMRFELDRRTPFAAEDVRFVHRVVARDQENIEVALTVAHKGVVDEAVAKAAELGVRVNAVDVEGAPGNLLPIAEPTHGRRRIVARAACLALAAIGAGALYQQIHNAETRAAELQQQIAAARVAAEAVTRQKEELAKAAEAARFLVARKEASPSITETLNELTRVLPNSTYLVQLEIREAELQFAGFSGASSELFPLIGRSPILAEPKFRSAVTMDQTAGRERFEIGAKIVRKVTQ
jgi:general secretion pathway protein L